MLVIETRKDNFEGHPITSASLHTRDKASWCYDRIEVRAKLPAGRGMWPAIWMLGINPGERRDSREPNLLLIGPAIRPGCA
jgi:beta-glucanase (GH16 family)